MTDNHRPFAISDTSSAISQPPFTQPIHPPVWWWGLLAVVVILAGYLNFTGYDYSLPYVRHYDEPAYNSAGYRVLTEGSAKSLGMQGYPPGIIYLNYVLLRLFHDPATPPLSMVGVVRFISVIFSLGVVVLAALLGYRLGTPVGGLLGAALWAISYDAIRSSRFATADMFVTFFALLAVYLTLTGTLHDRENLLKGGIYALIGAILFKYQAAFLLPLILLFPLLRLASHPGQRRPILRQFAWALGVFALFFVWLVLLYPSLEVGDSPSLVAQQNWAEIPRPAWVLGNLSRDVGALYLKLPELMAVTVGLILAFLPGFRQRDGLQGLLGLALAAVLWTVGLSVWGLQPVRQQLAVVVLIGVLVGAGLSNLIDLLARGLQRIRQPLIIRHAALIAALIVVLALTFRYQYHISEAVRKARQFALPDRMNDLMAWADVTLDGGDYVGSHDFHKVFDREWGGYPGAMVFDYRGAQSPADLVTPGAIEQLRDDGIRYLILNQSDWDSLQAMPGAADLDGDLTLLKSYPVDDAYRDTGIYVLWLYPIQHAVEGQVGPIRVVGYDLDRTTLRPGETLTLRLYWQADQPADTAYAVFNHLTTPESRDEVVSQVDGDPVESGRRPTTTWGDPDEIIVSQVFTLTIAAGTPPGSFRLLTGFYDRATGLRLTAPGGEDYVFLVEITVVR